MSRTTSTRAVREAEQFAAEDKKKKRRGRREETRLKTSAIRWKKIISENGDKLDSADKG